MAAVTRSTLSAVLKKLFTKDRVTEAVLRDHPGIALIPKQRGFGGGVYSASDSYSGGLQMCPIRYSRGGGRSATWAKAVANVVAPGTKGFILECADSYGYQTIEAKVLHSGNTIDESFIQGLEADIERDCLGKLGDDLAMSLFGDGAGVLFNVAAAWNGSDVAMPVGAPTSDVLKVHVGDVIVSAQDTSSAPYDTAAELTVVAVDATASPPTVTVDSLSGHTSMAGRTGYLFPCFISGDYVNASDRLKLKGFGAWIPATVTATAFCGVDRTVDVRALGGMRLDMSGYTMKEALLRGKAEVKKFTNKPPDLIIVSPDGFAKLEMELEIQGQYGREDAKTSAGFGYERIMLSGSEVVSDAFCANTKAWCLTRNTWDIYYLGPDFAFLVDDDGSIIMRQPASVGFDDEIRGASWSQLGCHYPGANCAVTVSL